MDNKKISGEDILLAVGEINERLLEVPSVRSCRAKRIGKLTSVAALLVSFAVIFNFYYNLVLKGANADAPDADSGITSSDGVSGDLSSGDKNEGTPGGGDGNGTEIGGGAVGDSDGDDGTDVDDENHAIPEHIIFGADGETVNMEKDDRLIKKHGDGILLFIELAGEGDAKPRISVFGSDGEVSDSDALTVEESFGYVSISTSALYQRLLISCDAWDFDLSIEFYDRDALAEFEITKINK